MNILIKGMELPHDCEECKLCEIIPVGAYQIFRKCVVLNRKAEYVIRRKDCPLVELPPHGDLISREWLVCIGLHLMNIAKNDDIANGVKWLWQYAIEAPTIIEAEGE